MTDHDDAQAFGAVGSLEAAYFRETGQQQLLSEQHLMDCAWDAKDENKGCMGGFQSLAFQWLFPHGGIASEADYPYEGVTDFCRKNITLGAKFSKVEPPPPPPPPPPGDPHWWQPGCLRRLQPGLTAPSAAAQHATAILSSSDP